MEIINLSQQSIYIQSFSKNKALWTRLFTANTINLVYNDYYIVLSFLNDMRIIRAIPLLAQKKKNKPRGRQSENETQQPEVNFFLLKSKVTWQQDTIMVIKCSANVVQHILVFFH